MAKKKTDSKGRKKNQQPEAPEVTTSDARASAPAAESPPEQVASEAQEAPETGTPAEAVDAPAEKSGEATPSETPTAEDGSSEPVPGQGAKKRTRRARSTPAEGTGRVSALDAAAQVLQEAGQPLSCQEMIKLMAEKGLWASPGGKTPAATLYSAILREMKVKGAASRFEKTERGRFARTATA
jgi:hypothetical protein